MIISTLKLWYRWCNVNYTEIYSCSTTGLLSWNNLLKSVDLCQQNYWICPALCKACGAWGFPGVFIPDPVQDPSRSCRFCCGLQVIQSPAQRLLSQQRCKWWMGPPAGRDQQHFHLFISCWPLHFFHTPFSSSLWSNLRQEMLLGYFLLVFCTDFVSCWIIPVKSNLYVCSHDKWFLLSFSGCLHY